MAMPWVPVKVLCSLALLGVGVIAGAYLAGWLLLMWLQLPATVELGTYWTYWKALQLPQLAPYASAVRIAGGLGFGASAVPCGMLLYVLWRVGNGGFHGDARFANRADLRRAGVLRRIPGEGILIGRQHGRYLWLNGAQHVLLVAPTRSGKSTSVAIPVLLSYEASAVVLDVKGELHALTSGYRRQIGQQIFVWSPYDESGCGHRFNPFTPLLGLEPRLRLAELQTMAAILYPDSTIADPFWMNQARTAFVAFASHLYEGWDARPGSLRDADPNTATGFPSFERIYLLTSGQGQPLKSCLQELMSASFISEQTSAVLFSLAGMADQTLSSVIASVQAPLQQFLSPVLAAATNATDFDVGALRRQRMTVYVIVPPKKLDEAGKLLNIFFSTVIGGNLQGDARSDPGIRHQVLMLMDEFTAMGRLDIWAKRISVSASYGVRDLAIVQSRAQLRAVYGSEDAQNFITNHGASLVFTPREQDDAEDYSRALGDRTVRRRQRSVSHGHAGSSRTTSFSEERRALMLPQELKEMPKDEQLIFLEGCRPIRCRKNWYFKDRRLKRRLLPPVQMPRRCAEPCADAPGSDPPPSTQVAAPAVGGIALCGSQSALTAEDAESPRRPMRAVHRQNVTDVLYDESLRRMCQLANARTLAELGPRPIPVRSTVRDDVATPVQKDSTMRLAQTMGSVAIAAGLAGCSPEQPVVIDSYAAKGAYIRSLPMEPKAYRRNPKPQQAYELTVTLENAPGPMVLMGGAASYEARNCSYLVNRFAGATAQPQASEEIHFTQVDVSTWRGTFFADAMLDEDSDGPQGTMLPCHWRLTHVDAWLQASGASGESVYSAAIEMDENHSGARRQRRWFSTHGYPRSSMVDGFVDTGVEKSPGLANDAEFSVLMAVQRISP